MFIQFFRAGLAYKSMLPMNWCPNCRTTLTNEELEDGKCNRCHGDVEVREKMQWNLAITKYADKFLDGTIRTRSNVTRLTGLGGQPGQMSISAWVMML